MNQLKLFFLLFFYSLWCFFLAFTWFLIMMCLFIHIEWHWMIYFLLCFPLSAGNQWNPGRWDGAGEDSPEYRPVGTLSRGEPEYQAKGFHSSHTSKKLCGIFNCLGCFYRLMKTSNIQLFCAPASFKESLVTGCAFHSMTHISLYHCCGTADLPPL